MEVWVYLLGTAAQIHLILGVFVCARDGWAKPAATASHPPKKSVDVMDGKKPRLKCKT